MDATGLASALSDIYPRPPSQPPAVQISKASVYESEGRTFESFRARQYLASLLRAKG